MSNARGGRVGYFLLGPGSTAVLNRERGGGAENLNRPLNSLVRYGLPPCRVDRCSWKQMQCWAWRRQGIKCWQGKTATPNWFSTYQLERKVNIQLTVLPDNSPLSFSLLCIVHYTISREIQIILPLPMFVSRLMNSYNIAVKVRTPENISSKPSCEESLGPVSGNRTRRLLLSALFTKRDVIWYQSLFHFQSHHFVIAFV